MIDVKDFKKNPQRYFDDLKRRGVKFTKTESDNVIAEIERRKKLLQEIEALKAQHNQLINDAATISEVRQVEQTSKSSGFQTSAQDMENNTKKSGEIVKQVKEKEARYNTSQDLSFGGERYSSLDEFIKNIPNLPKDDVPTGKDASDNKTVREKGEKPKLKLPKEYLALAEKLGIIDVERAAKVSGSRFGYLIGAAAELEFALIHYARSIVLPERFTMIVPPVLIKEDNMRAMGYLAGGGERETYHFEKDGLYLVGTSEQSVGPMHRDETFSEHDLPKRYLSFSTCFRREAGSYGKDTKGILRVHQFDKLEMFSFTVPEKSDEEHEFFLALQERLWQGLKIPYRVVKLCTGDLGYPSARTYDIEAWMPGQKTYREVASASTTTDYQSRDLNIKVKRSGRTELVHMLNGTAFAIGRTLIAIIENYQQPDGTVSVPDVLQPYLGGQKVISKA